MEKEVYSYAKIPFEIAKELGIANIRKRVSDGMVVINQSDMAGLEGDSLTEKVANARGIILTEWQAAQEIKTLYVNQQTETSEEPAPIFPEETEDIPQDDVPESNMSENHIVKENLNQEEKE